MLGMRHRIRHLAGRGLGLLSMSALLAFACFSAVPAYAACGGDSSELEYCDAPAPEYEKTPNKNRATSRKTGGPGQSPTSPGSTDEGESGRKSSTDDQSGGVPAHNDGGGKGGPGPQADKGDKSQKQPPAIDATPTSTDDDGGSSPLVPILIALAVLAAISIGAVAMRRRRDSDPGSPVSPEAS
jgi:hypothetical protein